MEKYEEASLFLFEKSFELVGTSESKGYANIFKDFVLKMANIQKDLNRFRLNLGLEEGRK
jgi:hypothetical protein